jgi:hypothetical protein
MLCQLSYGRVVLSNSSTNSLSRPTRQEGIEPPTYSLEGCRSIQLSYWRSLLPTSRGARI